MINPATRSTSSSAITKVPRYAIQLFEPPEDAVYTIDATAHLVGIPRRTILVYCKHRLLSPVINARDRGYSFDRDGIRALRRIDALRVICGQDLSGIKIILDLTRELERLHSVVRFLSQDKWPRERQKNTSRQRPRANASRGRKSKLNRRRK
jgi:DNA-binding transcriptional MerR regulator